MNHIKEIFGILAIVLGISAAVPYIYEIVKKSSKPHRISWAIWSFISILTLTSYVSAGAHWSALLALAAALNNFVIFLLSLKFGTGGLSTQDRIAFGIAIVGIVLWVITRQAAFGLVFALGADLVGLVLTLNKTHKDPNSESALAWAISTLASVAGLLAVHNYNFTQTIYPVYAVAAGLCLFLVSTIGRKKK